MTIWPSFKEQSVFAWLLSILMSLVIIAIIAITYLAWASSSYQREWNNTITVEGEAVIEQAPTKAVVYFWVDTDGETVEVAQEQNNETIEAILAALEGLIDAEDIQTENYDVYQNEVWNPETREYDQRGWVVNQRVEVTVENVDDAGQVLSLLGANGATDISGPNYEADDDANMENTARLEAIAEARAEAESIADALDQRLGRMVDYSEYSYGEDEYYDYGYSTRSFDAVAESAAVSLSPGTEETTFYVSITYKLR